MKFIRNLRIPLPLPVAGLVLLAAVYLLVGLFGHSPWKAEDAIGIGIMHGMLSSGPQGWLVPHLAGEIYLDDGPLYYALAALCAKLLSFILAPHDGARLASALCMLATLWFARAAAREWFRADGQTAPAAAEGDGAALMLIGTLGLFVHAHEVLAENAALSGAAIAWYGLARARAASLRGGLWFGLGLGLMLWTKGPAPALAPLAAALAAPLLGSAWRSRAYLRFLATGLAVAALAALAGYAALRGLGGEGLPAAWWDRQRILVIPDAPRLLRLLQLLCWSVWPAWPLAAVALHDRRHRLKNDPILPIAAGIVAGAAVFMFSRELNEVFAMPLMLPLALAAGAGAPALRRGTASGFAWFGAMTFSVLGGLVWLGWVAMVSGVPQQIARNFARLEPGFKADFDGGALAIALALTLLWLALLARSTRSTHRSPVFWAGGVALLWGLAMTLWLPWIDYGKTYRPVALSLAAAVKQSRVKLTADACIASRGLGEAQRAVFDYYGNIVTHRLEVHPRSDCPLLLVQADSRQSGPDRVGPEWRRVWEGNRPRDRERFRLYLRD